MKRIIRKGFTLIELLIVMVVIAVLSSMMMISSMEVAYTAEANNIIEGFVQLRTAFHMWCADHPDSFDEIISATKIQNVPGLTSYMEKGNSFWNEVTSYIQKHSEPSNSENKHYYYKMSSYKFWIGDGNKNGKVLENTGLYIVYEITGKTVEKQRIAAKLAGRAQSVGLVGNKNFGKDGKSPIYTNGTKDGLKYVLYRIL